MTDQVIEQPTEQAVESVDELGPVDWLVVEFSGSRFKGEIAPIYLTAALQPPPASPVDRQ